MPNRVLAESAEDNQRLDCNIKADALLQRANSSSFGIVLPYDMPLSDESNAQ